MTEPITESRSALRLTLTVAFLGFVLIHSVRVLFSLYALELGARPFVVGTLAAMLYVVPLLLAWRVGVLFDRLGARWLLTFGYSCGALGMLIPYFVRTLPALYVAAGLCGISIAFSNVMLQSLMGILSRPQDRTRNFSNYSMVASTALFVGPMLTGFAIDHLGHAVASLLIALAPLGALALLLVRGGLFPGGQRGKSEGGSIWKSLADPAIQRMLAVCSLVQFGMDLFQFYIPLYGHGIGLSASAIGATLAAYAMAAFVVRFAMPRLIKLLGEEGLLTRSFWLSGVCFLLIPVSHNAVALAAVAFLFGLCMGCGGPLTLMLMFNRSVEGRAGETLGLRLTVNYLARMVGPSVFGLIASAFGLLPVFIVNALMMAAGGRLTRIRRAPAVGNGPKDGLS